MLGEVEHGCSNLRPSKIVFLTTDVRVNANTSGLAASVVVDPTCDVARSPGTTEGTNVERHGGCSGIGVPGVIVESRQLRE